MAKKIQHDAIRAIKRVAKEIDDTPSKNTYKMFRNDDEPTQHQIIHAFASWTRAIDAAGLTRIAEKPRVNPHDKAFKKELKDQLKTIFDSKIIDQIREQVLENGYVLKNVQGKKILIIGDTHFPFICKVTMNFIFAMIKKMKPDIIIQIGDLYDFFAHGRFPRSMNTYNPFEEVQTGRHLAEDMWRTVRKLAPKAKCYQMYGNHDLRPLKKLLQNSPELEMFFNIRPWFEFDGVELIDDPRQELIIDDIVFYHGYLSKLGAHRDYNQCKTVCGHSHTGGVSYRNTFNGIIWELNAGFCGDPQSKGLSYTAQKMTKWTPGFGWIDALGPRFIHLDVDRDAKTTATK